MIRRFGFDRREWRLDPAVHPFATSIGDHRHPPDDAVLRATTSTASSRRCTSAGTASTSTGSPASSSARRSRSGASLGLHESQSRMWENLVGRSLPFWRYFFPQLQRDLPGRARRAYDARGLVPRGQLGRAVADPRRGRRGDLQPAHHPALRARAGAARGHVRRSRSCPRTGTSGCGTTSASSCPTTARRAPGHALGVGSIGYFPTYALGNLISAQLWEKVIAEIPDLHDQFEQGEFGALARLAAREPLAPRPQVHAARARRADHRRRTRLRSRTCATCAGSYAASRL